MTIYLVRHGSAGSRDDEDPNDDERGLDDVGRVQAHKLAEWLRHGGVTRVLSSPYRRCVETVEPLANALGVGIEVCDGLGEQAGIDQSWAVIESVAGEVAVVCSHGDVIPDVVRRAKLRGMHIPGKSGCAKGSVWTLEHWNGHCFATGVYTPIPGV
jgi:phosphohistidine phosphatase SixA